MKFGNYCFHRCPFIRSNTNEYTNTDFGETSIEKDHYMKNKLKIHELSVSNIIVEQMEWIQHETNKLMNEILYDSDIDYSRRRPNRKVIDRNNLNEIEQDEIWPNSFFERIQNKSNLVFFFFTSDGILFGQYTSSIIHEQRIFIEDENAFLFTFKDHIPQKFPIMKQFANRAIMIFHENSLIQRLIKFGNDIVIGKPNEL